ncbi:ABC transporter permease subunit [Streptomyces sp. NPDC058045]|uniref:methionine ABC transporter permease n=1 Tax=Streptomyces sp. NPDC058045 TaxID=3346311 RepID=UPI0036E6F71B
MTWSETQPLLAQACWDTLYMVGWSTLIAVVGGLPLGILLVLTDRGGLLANALVNKVIGQIVNIARSMPFIILMVALMGFTRAVTGTTIGREAAIVPLAIGAIPFFARLVETSVREVDGGLVEAVQSMGGNTWTIVRKVLVPEALPSLIAGVTTTVVVLIGYSAMAGTVGAGGLGDLAVRYGYQRFETGLMWITVAVLAVAISVIQFAGDLLARRLHHRGGPAPALRLLRPRTPNTPATSGTSAATGTSAAPAEPAENPRAPEAPAGEAEPAKSL